MAFIKTTNMLKRIRELADEAEADDFATLAYLLRMAELEADLISIRQLAAEQPKGIQNTVRR